MASRPPFDPVQFVRRIHLDWISVTLVIVVSIIVALLSLFNLLSITGDQLLDLDIAIMGILASLAVSNAVKIWNQEIALRELAAQTKRNDLAALVLRRRQQRPNVEEFFNNAKRIVICDPFLGSFPIEQNQLVHLLQDQCDVAVATLDPHNGGRLADMSALSGSVTSTSLRLLLEGGIENIVSVHDYIEANSPVAVKKGTIELKYFDGFMPFAGVLVETRDQQDRVFIELFPFKYDELTVHRHHFVVDQKNTPDLFNTYKNAVERMLSHAQLQPFPSPVSQSNGAISSASP